jgi:hypothetical protein
VTFFSEATVEGATAVLTLRHNEAEERSAGPSSRGGGSSTDPTELVDQTPYVYSLTGAADAAWEEAMKAELNAKLAGIDAKLADVSLRLDRQGREIAGLYSQCRTPSRKR